MSRRFPRPRRRLALLVLVIVMGTGGILRWRSAQAASYRLAVADPRTREWSTGYRSSGRIVDAWQVACSAAAGHTGLAVIWSGTWSFCDIQGYDNGRCRPGVVVARYRLVRENCYGDIDSGWSMTYDEAWFEAMDAPWYRYARQRVEWLWTTLLPTPQQGHAP